MGAYIQVPRANEATPRKFVLLSQVGVSCTPHEHVRHSRWKCIAVNATPFKLVEIAPAAFRIKGHQSTQVK
jgi:hypothetical protein